jgi:hypothetical protein
MTTNKMNIDDKLTEKIIGCACLNFDNNFIFNKNIGIIISNKIFIVFNRNWILLLGFKSVLFQFYH